HLRALHPFPTRRSSDLLNGPRRAPAGLTPRPRRLKWWPPRSGSCREPPRREVRLRSVLIGCGKGGTADDLRPGGGALDSGRHDRSEEHTSELQSRENLV